MVSVIIPNYNNQQYLSECLNSVLNQTFEECEIVVVDDCSTDQSRELLRDFASKDKRVRLIENEINMGVVKTRDRGIRAARYPYVTTLDSDDYYYDNQKLEHEVALLKQYLDRGETVMPFSNTVLVDQDGNYVNITVTAQNLKEGWIFDDLLLRKCAVPRDFIFSKAHYFEVLGYDPLIPIYEDWDLKLRLARLAPFVYTQKEGVAYRQTLEGLSTTSVFRHIKWKNYVFNKNVAGLGKGYKGLRVRVQFRFKLAKELLWGLRNFLVFGLAKS